MSYFPVEVGNCDSSIIGHGLLPAAIRLTKGFNRCRITCVLRVLGCWRTLFITEQLDRLSARWAW